MAIRSLTDIWVDANFKETQLGSLRIGQKADLDVDMYGSHRRFEGRISGFTMGTGSYPGAAAGRECDGKLVKSCSACPCELIW